VDWGSSLSFHRETERAEGEGGRGEYRRKGREREKGEKESGTSVVALIVILLEKSWFANGTGH